MAITSKLKKIKEKCGVGGPRRDFLSSLSIFIRSIGAILVYDITKRNSFENIAKWLEETKTYANDKMVIMLVGNKTDLGKSKYDL